MPENSEKEKELMNEEGGLTFSGTEQTAETDSYADETSPDAQTVNEASDAEEAPDNVTEPQETGYDETAAPQKTEVQYVDDWMFSQFPPPKKPKRMYFLKGFLWTVSVAMVAFMIAFIYSVSERYVPEGEIDGSNSEIPTNKYADFSNTEEISLPDAPDVSADPDAPQISVVPAKTDPEGNKVSKAFKKASPSIVCITSYKGGEDYVLNKIGTGSGIIVDAGGCIVTNSHVVDNSMSTGVMVTLYDGSQYLGKIIGVDQKTDIAVLQIDAEGLVPAEITDSDSLYVGQEVYAIGSPGGSNFSNSLTKGTVSALNRVLQSNGYIRYIQTDAAINPGNSGGALINEVGQVIGMNTAKIVTANYEGMGFAIPSNKIKEIAEKLRRFGYVNDRGTLGIEGTTCNLYESKSKNVPEGMAITKINSDSPLADTNVLVQDIIININGVRVKSTYEFIDELSKFKPGDEVVLTMFRASSDPRVSNFSFDVSVTLIPDEKPA